MYTATNVSDEEPAFNSKEKEKKRPFEIHICSSLKQEFRTTVITFDN